MKHRNLPNVNNIGYIDASLRVALGVGALSPALMQVPHNGWNFVAISALLSIYPLLTAVYRWDPLYQLFDIRSTKESIPQENRIEEYLEVSRQYLSSLTGTSKLNSSDPAANDGGQQRLSA